MIQFYAPDIETDPVLSESESIHCVRVMRMKAGDEITVTDGKGNRYICVIETPHPAHTGVFVKEKIALPPERTYKLTLAVAPTKNTDRMEWMVEKAVEIGVDKIVFLKCARSERKVLRPDRLLKVMISAMKQSLSGRLPVMEELEDFKEFIEKSKKDNQKFFGYCSPSFPKKEFVKECKSGGAVTVMIGPEGDFTEEEVAKAVEKGFIPVTFGEKRLRTETAGVFAICAVNVINQMA